MKNGKTGIHFRADLFSLAACFRGIHTHQFGKKSSCHIILF
jgi:hypothetical protein